jgi:hypothetical protein
MCSQSKGIGSADISEPMQCSNIPAILALVDVDDRRGNPETEALRLRVEGNRPQLSRLELPSRVSAG